MRSGITSQPVGRGEVTLTGSSVWITRLRDGRFRFTQGDRSFTWAHEGYLSLKGGGEIPFADAQSIELIPWESGLGKGIDATYRDFASSADLSFKTRVWIERTSDQILCEWIPLSFPDNLLCEGVYWPAAMEPLSPRSADGLQAYSVLPYQSGQILPVNWQTSITAEHRFGTVQGSMAWFGQVDRDASYSLIVETPWDAAYRVTHQAGGPTQELALRWLPSLGGFHDRRVVRYGIDGSGSDYGRLCAHYHAYVKRTRTLVPPLTQIASPPSPRRLLDGPVLERTIKVHVAAGSDLYDHERPECNDRITPFEHLHLEGVHLLLRGWGEGGHDNRHPDVLPPSQAAGGWEGLRALREAVSSLGLCDDVRHAYLDAPSYRDEEMVPLHDAPVCTCRAGGAHRRLCPSFAEGYLRRTITAILEHDLRPDEVCLSGFTEDVVECTHPEHLMSRRASLEAYRRCFAYLHSEGMLPSLEGFSDSLLPAVALVHQSPIQSHTGIAVPLVELVYHDAVVASYEVNSEASMLYTLLYAGLPRFKEGVDEGAAQKILEIQGTLAGVPMISHAFLESWERQRTRFADGTSVWIDLARGTWEISQD